MFENQHAMLRDAFGPGEALNSLTAGFLRFLEVEFANFEHGLRNAPNQEEIGDYNYYSSHQLLILLSFPPLLVSRSDGYRFNQRVDGTPLNGQ
jgi:hypothetical protein